MFRDREGRINWVAISVIVAVLAFLFGDEAFFKVKKYIEERTAPENEVIASMEASESDEALKLAVTRGEAVLMLWTREGSPAPKAKNTPFEDVALDASYRSAVLWAAEKGLIIGKPDTLFRPNEPMTRAQAVTVLYRLKGEKMGGVLPFTDVEAGSFYEEAVVWAFYTGVTKGTSPTTFSPDEPCTRQQLRDFIRAAYVDSYIFK